MPQLTGLAHDATVAVIAGNTIRERLPRAAICRLVANADVALIRAAVAVPR
jgi:hypothetical protein